MSRTARERALARARYAIDPAPKRAAARRWRASNPERNRANTLAWQAAHPEAYVTRRDTGGARSSTHKWSAAHPERVLAKARRRRARIARVLATLTPKEWEAILDAAGHACIYCGSRKQITQDHLMPISRGGNHTAENVAPACAPCNQSKGAKAVMEFLAEKED